MARAKLAANPFKAGAGHSPPYLAGRDREADQFAELLRQEVVTQNIVLTGLRGVGKTVLMDDVYKPLALKGNWVWVGSDFSETAFVDEESLCRRLLTDLSLFTATLALAGEGRPFGFGGRGAVSYHNLDFQFLVDYFNARPGLTVDRLKATLEFAWSAISASGKRGIVFAYDEAQVVQDRKDKDQYPLAMLLETFQSLQKRGMRYFLLLTGLPTLFPKLVESRTYAERMFSVQEIGKIDPPACEEAIVKPLRGNPIQFSPASVRTVVDVSKCYPYFIQFICREAYDFFKSQPDAGKGKEPGPIPIETLVRKLDSDFFSGRWGRATNRQRELLLCIANLENADGEFTVSQIVESSRETMAALGGKIFKTGDVQNMIPKLIESGLVYKNRHGKYVLAVPLFDGFIKRQFPVAG